MFFSEEKNQTTFMSCAGYTIEAQRGSKIFLLLFFKKECFLHPTND